MNRILNGIGRMTQHAVYAEATALCNTAYAASSAPFAASRAGISMQAFIATIIAVALLFAAAGLIHMRFNRRRQRAYELERARLRALAELDPLTGILNRSALKTAIDQALQDAAADDKSAMFVLDLDNLKQINDLSGHQAGDETLIRIASAMRRTFHENALIGRLGGDEFMAFIPRCHTDMQLDAIAASLLAATQYFVNDIPVSTSIGVSMCDGGSKTFDALYRDADAALYTAKASGKSRYCIAGTDYGVVRLPRDVVSVHLQTLIESVNGGIMLAEVGSEVQIRYISPSLYRHLHTEDPISEDAVNALLDLILPADRPLVDDALRRAASAGEVSDCVYRVSYDEGVRWRHLQLTRVSELGGSTLVIGVISDITQLKQSEARIRDAEERYRVAVRQTGCQVWEVDLKTRTLHLSNAGMTDADATVYENVPETILLSHALPEGAAEELRRMFDDLYGGVEGREYLYELTNEDGELTYSKARFGYVFNDEGERVRAIGVTETMPNVGTEMRAFNEELRFMEMMRPSLLGAIIANLSKDAIILCTVLPEFPTPSTYSALFEMRGAFVASSDYDAFSQRASAESLLARYQAGQLWMLFEIRRKLPNAEPRWTNLVYRLARHPISGDVFVFGYMRDMQTAKNWELSLDRPAERDATTFLYTSDTFASLFETAVRRMGDETLCSLCVYELVGAARLKAEQGLAAAQKTLLTLARLCRITISGDVAIGHIDETHIAALRTNVNDADAERAQITHDQTRILSMLRQSLVGQEMDLNCGYTISRASEAGFDEMLRRALVACGMAKQSAGSHTMAYALHEGQDDDTLLLMGARGAQQRRILVVDDDPVSRALLKKILSDRWQVTEATDGARALEALRAQAFDLVICDLFMPVLSGWEVLERMRESKRLAAIPVVAITSDVMPASEVNALNLGATDVIRKPFAPEILISRVSNILHARDSARIAEQNRLYEIRFQQQSRSLWLAEHDELTGIYNRQAFYRHMRQTLDENPDKPYVLIRWDLDDFKIFNDAMGTQAGDRLLRDIGAAIQEHADPDSIYGRIEADHFVHLLPVGSHTPEDVYARISRWLHNYPVEFQLLCRVGAYVLDDPSLDPNIICDRALLALRSIKGSFSERVAYYDESMRIRLVEEQALANEMASALAGGQFEVYFQPQYNYETGEMIGAEALARWNHPVRGMIPPSVFIPLFERNGFVSRLDEFVWETSCKYMHEWMNAENKVVPVSVSVNISRIDLYDVRLCDKLFELVKRYGIPVSSLKLEITESAYMQNPDQLVVVVKRLQDLGFLVEMDDFGSGYSSLNTLKDVPVNILKLDMRFLSRGEDDSRGGNILSSVLRMAHWLKIPVIAEGVETKAQADYLKSLGCAYMQGYFFARPMPAEAFHQLLHKSAVGSTNRYAGTDTDGMAQFWDPSAQSALLFNSFVGGAAIVEFRRDSAEIMRANDRFYRELTTDRTRFLSMSGNLFDHFDEENRAAYRRMLDEAVATQDETDCEVVCMVDGAPVWTHNRARMLARNAESCLVYVAIENITARKLLEQQTLRQERALHQALLTSRAEEERDRLVLKYLKSLVFYYDCDNDALSYQAEQPDAEMISRTITPYLLSAPPNSAIHPDYLELFRSHLQSATLAPTSGTLEYVANYFGTGDRWNRAHYASVADEAGHVFRVVGVVYDVQHEKDHHDMIANLSARLSEQSAATDYNSGIIERVFSHLYNAHDTDTAIQSALAALGENYGVSRAYIFEDTDDHACCCNTFEWCAPGVSPQKAHLSCVSYQDDLGSSYRELFGQSGVLFCPDVSVLPAKQYEFLARQGIRSMLQCAIMDNGTFCGCIGFDDCTDNRIWTGEQVATLSLVGKLIGAFVVMARAAKKAALSREFREALDNNTAFVYIIDPQTYEIAYENGAILDYAGCSHTGEHCYKAFCNQDAPCENCPLHARDETGKPRAVEILRSDGLRVMAQASPIRIEGREMRMITSLGVAEGAKTDGLRDLI